MSVPVLNNIKSATAPIEGNTAGISNDQQSHLDGSELVKSTTIIYIVLSLLVLFFVWASVFSIDEVTRGDGKVIPSSKIKVVQHLEGGIVEQIYVAGGDYVEKGSALVLLDSKRMRAQLAEANAEINNIQAEIARYDALLNNTRLVIPKALTSIEDIQAHKQAFNTERSRYQAELNGLEEEKNRLQSELRGTAGRLISSKQEKAIAKELNASAKRLAELGAISKKDAFTEEMQLISVIKDIGALESKQEELRHLLAKTDYNLEQVEKKYQTERWEKLSHLYANQKAQEAKNKLSIDGVNRAVIRAPISGIVKQIFINAPGAVLQAGGPILEIVPIDGDLLVEANIRPQDIGFIALGQKAVIKVSAYDFTIYGGLTGTVVHISPDSIITEDENFYRVKIRIKKGGYTRNKDLTLKPGMTIGVDILTGEKTVLQYLFKPLTRGLNQAMTER